MDATSESRRLQHLTRIGVIWIVILFGRMIQLQVLQHDRWVNLARGRQEHVEEIPARRGLILDRNGRELAGSEPTFRVIVNPRMLPDPDIAADVIGPPLGIKPAELSKTIRNAHHPKGGLRGYLPVAVRVPGARIAGIRKLRLDWLSFEEDSRRLYVKDRLAANVVGSVDGQERGNSGIEKRFDKDLRGVPGERLVVRDRRAQGIDTIRRVEPHHGTSIGLSIDERIQFQAERVLERAVTAKVADTGTIVVMNPRNGDILAMASYPTFNPNSDPEAKLNLAVSVAPEPGSVMKLFLLAGLMDRTGLKATSSIHCGDGSWECGKVVIHDKVGWGMQPLETVLAKSINGGAVHAAQLLKRERFHDVLSSFGFGRKTGIELPAEIPGIFREPSTWRNGQMCSMAIGYAMTATAIQLAQATSAIANGGLRVTPRIVLWKESPDGQREMMPESPRVRILRPETAIDARRMSEAVVLEGTGKAARMNHYWVGGKTGTSKQNSKGQYIDHGRYNATFVGLAPLRSPEMVAVITLHGARQDAGISAAPLFIQVADPALRYLGVEPDSRPDRAAALIAVSQPVSDPGLAPEEIDDDPAALPVDTESRELLVRPAVPDLHGLSKREVLKEAMALGLPVELYGQGLVSRQQPPAGAFLGRGQKVRVDFARVTRRSVARATP